jgi:glycerophosphoryl diester phosphodiesterase
MNGILIGHRGEPENWPENSLAGYQAILEAGARYLETDVQISADGVPVLSHDPSLLKITGHDLLVTETPFEKIQSLSAGHAERFGDRYRSFRIAALAQFAGLLTQWPDSRAFIEIKHASIKAFGANRVIDLMLDTLADVLGQCTFISFEHAALQHACDCVKVPVGWVLPEWSNNSRQLAETLAPDYLFVNRKRLPPAPEPLWPGPWQWTVYIINDAREIKRYLERGFALVETNVISRLLAGQAGDD